MEPHEVKQLETRAAEAVQMLLVEGDQVYLQGLTRDALFKALEVEMQFLGLCRHGDTAAQEVVRHYIARHLDDWMDVIHNKTHAE